MTGSSGWLVRNTVLKTIRAHSLFDSGDTVVVAVSGGADSVALLDILVSLEQFRLSLVVAHLNHTLRGDESDDDETFVRLLAARYGLPCEIGRADVRSASRREKLSLEEAGRVARYAFLREVAARYRANAIAVAHHADDQAETVMMRLLRGAGTAGLAGMAPKSGERLVRPLLGVTRAEIEAYLLSRGMSYRNDSSNTDTSFLRNRVRHELLPYLATYNPSVRGRLVAMADVLAADEELLEEVTAAAFSRHGRGETGMATLCATGLRAELAGVRLRLYRRAILLAKGSLARIGSRHLHDIDRLVVSPRPHATLVLPGGIRVARSYDTVTFRASPGTAGEALPEVVLEGPGAYPLPGGGTLLVEEAEFPGMRGGDTPAVACFDADAAPFPWVVRAFCAGDRIIPLGMSGHKKVKDIFIDEKVPLQTRRRLPLLLSRGNIIWVCTLRVSAQTRITERTGRIMRAEILGFSP
ncbi:MAG TPA: tRNA lysidine(34) synthetase TilS [Geobacteraceae bacterium]